MAVDIGTEQLGRYPAARRVIAHVSDTHLLFGGAPLGGVADTVGALRQTAAQLGRLGDRLDAIVVTGDVTDLGEPDAYRRVHEALQPVVTATGAEIVWVMGNHDERGAFRESLIGEAPSGAPVNCVVHVGGLRMLALDTSVPGYHHGEIDAASLAWLDEQLAQPAPEGTIIAMHHAPIATPLALMDVLELRGQDELAEVIRDRDVRLILGGHLHYATNGVFAGIPVSVAGATAYTMDLSAPTRARGDRRWPIVHARAPLRRHPCHLGRAARSVRRGDELRGGFPRRARGTLGQRATRALLAQAARRTMSAGSVVRVSTNPRHAGAEHHRWRCRRAG